MSINATVLRGVILDYLNAQYGPMSHNGEVADGIMRAVLADEAFVPIRMRKVWTDITKEEWDAIVEQKAPPAWGATEHARAALAWHARVEAAARAMLDNPPFMAKHDGCTADNCHVIALYDILQEKAVR